MLLRTDSSEAAEGVDIPPSVVGSMSWSNDGESLALSLSSPTMNSDVWILRPLERSVRRLTFSSTNGIPGSTFSPAESFHYKSFDDLEVQAFFYRSPFPGPRPLVVMLHGGPESQFRPGFNPLIQFLVRLGFVVVAPNFRGSTGYGRAFTHLDDVYNRMDTVKDALLVVAKVRERAQIDANEVVAWGGSYGGFMVLASLYTAPEMWAAGVDIVGISNFVTFLENTGPWRRKLRIAEYGDPVKDRAFLEGISPLNNAHLIKAPLFIIHGTNDPRVPVGEAGQIIQTMHKLGREAHLLLYPDEGHGLVKLENRVDGYSKAVEFIMSHLGRDQGPNMPPTED
jgi:dipeptidyl aminopeptidase/acylaminoacyl peptidase